MKNHLTFLLKLLKVIGCIYDRNGCVGFQLGSVHQIGTELTLKSIFFGKNTSLRKSPQPIALFFQSFLFLLMSSSIWYFAISSFHETDLLFP